MQKFISGLVHSHKIVCPWLTRDAINNEMRRRARDGIFYREELMNPATTRVEDSFDSIGQVKGKRHVGTNDTAKKHCENAVLATKMKLQGYMKGQKSKLVRNGYLTGIFNL